MRLLGDTPTILGGRAILRASVVADEKAMSVMSHTPVVD